MQVFPFIGYVGYRKHCVIVDNGKCRVRETASNSQGLDTPSNGHGRAGIGYRVPCGQFYAPPAAVQNLLPLQPTLVYLNVGLHLRFLSCATQTNIALSRFFDVHMNRRNVFYCNCLVLTVLLIEFVLRDFYQILHISIIRHFQSMVITRRFCYLTFPVCGHQ